MRKTAITILLPIILLIVLTLDSFAQAAPQSSVAGSLNVKFAETEGRGEVEISAEGLKSFNVMRLKNPDRIVIDMPGVKGPSGQQKDAVNKGVLKSIRYAQFDAATARVVLDVSGQTDYFVEKGTNRLKITLDKPRYGCITYHNSGDRVYVTLDGVKLTEGGEDLKKFYEEKYDSTGKRYTITFSSKLAGIKTGSMKINDGMLNSIQVTNNKAKGTTSIIFGAKDKFNYLVFTRPEVKDTAITIMKPASKDEKLVVIDPGHGGAEPGAIYKGLYEKDLNLDIALRLNKLLRNKNIKTYMTREDDSFVGLFERAYIANNLNASLFLSIHNNAMSNANYGGTMTLHYPSRSSGSFNGRDFARIVQNSLVSRLGTTDRSVIERPNLIVLRATTMPAALAEVAFMTNEADRNNLQKEAFRQKAALALCEAVVKALNNR